MKLSLPSPKRAGLATQPRPTPAKPRPVPPPPAVPPPVTPPPIAAEGFRAERMTPPADPHAGPAVGQVLPIYFVGDESHSMAGAPITAVNQGLVDLRDEVAKHPLIGKKVRFGVVTFADTAETRLELSALSEDLILPTLPRDQLCQRI
jgi:hypothetical protein